MFNNRQGKVRIKNVILIGIAAICLIVGVILLLIDPIKNMRRQKVTDDMMESIVEESQATFVVKSSGNEVNGEDVEYYYGEEEYGSSPADYDTIVAQLPEEVVLTALGTISIPSVDIEIPLWDSATLVSLRYGAGRLEGTCEPGQEGNMTVLGHRMRAEGKLFHSLGEVKIGDKIEISCIDGNHYTYIVDKIYDSVNPGDLDQYIDIDDGTGKQITLVTCTPLGVATHRLLVVGHIQE
ncbi:MAG: class D sortase [Clostridiales bacterium]|nr:class D sortase [Candidatus Scatonaster coprocaballi]